MTHHLVSLGYAIHLWNLLALYEEHCLRRRDALADLSDDLTKALTEPVLSRAYQQSFLRDVKHMSRESLLPDLDVKEPSQQAQQLLKSLNDILQQMKLLNVKEIHLHLPDTVVIKTESS